MEAWDPAGQDKYGDATLINAFYRDAHGLALVYNVNDEASFEGMKALKEQVEEKVG